MDKASWHRILESVGHLQAGATADDIDRAEGRLGSPLPPSLKELYQATNGIYHPGGQWYLMWKLGDLVDRNLDAWRDEPAARRQWLGFGDDGTGAPFCLSLDGTPTASRMLEDLRALRSVG